MEKEALKNFKKDLIIYRKYEETIKSILALIEYRRKVSEHEVGNTPILDILFDRIIDNLSDKNVKVSYKGNAKDLVVMLNTMTHELYNKYEKKIDMYYLDQVDVCIYSRKKWDCEYNLMNYVLDNYNSWRKSYKMLFSDIPVETRSMMFNDYLTKMSDTKLLRGELLENSFAYKKFLELKDYNYKKLEETQKLLAKKVKTMKR